MPVTPTLRGVEEEETVEEEEEVVAELVDEESEFWRSRAKW